MRLLHSEVLPSMSKNMKIFLKVVNFKQCSESIIDGLICRPELIYELLSY